MLNKAAVCPLSAVWCVQASLLVPYQALMSQHAVAKATEFTSTFPDATCLSYLPSRIQSSPSSSPPFFYGPSPPYFPPSSTTLPSSRPTGPGMIQTFILSLLPFEVGWVCSVCFVNMCEYFLCPNRSGENRTTMHKCYTFLIFMVLLLPSLGLSR